MLNAVCIEFYAEFYARIPCANSMREFHANMPREYYLLPVSC